MAKARSILRALGAAGSADAELVGRYADRSDGEAFAELTRRHGAAVAAICRRLLGRGPEAEDAAQAVWLTLARRAGSLRDPEAVGGWLVGTARRVAGRMRRRRRDTPSPVPAAPPGPHDGAASRESLDIIHEELGRLPDRERAALVLCGLQGLPRAETARRLGVPLGTLKRRLEAGRRLLRDRLARRGVPVTAAAAVLIGGRAAIARSATRSLFGRAVALAGVILAGAAGLAFTQAAPPAGGDPPPRNDRLGDPLPKGAVARLGTLRYRVGGDAPVALLPGSRFAVTASREVKIWHLHTGKVARRWPVPAAKKSHELASVAVSKNGKRIAAGGEDGLVRVWSAEGRLLHTLKGHAFEKQKRPPVILFLAFAGPDRLVSWGTERAVIVWDLKAGRSSHRVKVNGMCALTADGSRVASVGGKGMPDGDRLKAWDVPTGQLLFNVKLPGAIDRIAISNNGKRIAVGPFGDSDDYFIAIHDGATGRKLCRLRCGSLQAVPAMFSPDGRRLFGTSSRSGRALWIAWDARTGEPLRGTELRDTSGFHRASFPPDGRRIITLAGTGTISVRDAMTGRRLTPAGGHVEPISSVRFAPGGRLVTTTYDRDEAGCVRTWDWRRGVTLSRRDLPARKEHWMDLIIPAPGGRLCVVHRKKGGLMFLRVADGSVARRAAFPSQDLPRGFFTFGRGGRLFAAANKNDVHVIRLDGTDPVTVLTAAGGPVNHTSFSPDGRLIAAAVGSVGRPLRVWDWAAKRELKFVPPAAGAGRQFGARVAFSPDGRSLAVSRSHGGGIDVYEVATGRVCSRVEAGDTLDRLAFAPGGRYLAAGGTGYYVRGYEAKFGWVSSYTIRSPGPAVYIYDLLTGREVRRFEGHRGTVTALAFSEDGRRLASGGSDTTALIWDTSDLID